MAFKEVESNTWQPENENDSIEGVLVKVEREVGINKANLYHLETSDKKNISVWGSAVLDSKMTFVKEGDILRITYLGLGEKKIGQNPAKLFKVEIDRD